MCYLHQHNQLRAQDRSDKLATEFIILNTKPIIFEYRIHHFRYKTFDLVRAAEQHRKAVVLRALQPAVDHFCFLDLHVNAKSIVFNTKSIILKCKIHHFNKQIRPRRKSRQVST